MENTITPVCRTCHTSIGHIYPVYEHILEHRIEKYNREDGFELNDFAAMENVSMEDVFKKLNINNLCCRGQIMGFVATVPKFQRN